MMTSRSTNLILKLRILSFMCQIYVILISISTLGTELIVTIPAYCASNTSYEEENHVQWKFNFAAIYIFFNVIGNYFCVKYKAHLSSYGYDRDCTPNISSEVCPSNLTKEKCRETIHQANIHYFNAKADWEDSREDFLHLNVGSSYPDIARDNSSTVYNYNQLKFEISNHDNNNMSKSTSILFSNGRDNAFCNLEQWCGSEKLQTAIADWYMCRECHKIRPPRAKHCPVCNVCILKRDHHCFFTGCCVGYHNQRYFTLFCFYGALGTIYSTITIYYYLSQHYQQFQTFGYLSLFPPFVLYFWLSSALSSLITFLLILQYLSIASIMICLYFFLQQMYLTLCGQTTYEYFKNIKMYGGTVKNNVYSVFGNYWFVGFFIPAPFLGYVGDGIAWYSSAFCSKIL